MKTYLFTYSQMCPVWQAQAILNTTGAVTTWVQPFPQAAIIVSTLNAHDLAAVFRSRLGETWFLITELNSAAVNGYLPGNLWQFIQNAPNASLPFFAPFAPQPIGPGQPSTDS